MQISSPHYLSQVPQCQESNKDAPQLDRVSLQASKMCTEELIDNPLKGRMSTIRKELIRLDDNPKFFSLLVRAHYLYFYWQKGTPDIESFTCQDSVFAMIQLNLFKHKLYREIDNLKMFECELQNNEEGTFSVRIPGAPFVNNLEERIFQGHDFIIFKVREMNNNSYFVAHSFVDQYSLKSFISENKMIYENFDQLKKAVLDPVESIINKSGKWTEKECQAYCDLTSIYPDWLIGFSNSKQECLLKVVEFGRSSNVYMSGKDTVSLGKFGENGFEFPKECKTMIKEVLELVWKK